MPLPALLPLDFERDRELRSGEILGCSVVRLRGGVLLLERGGDISNHDSDEPRFCSDLPRAGLASCEVLA